MPRISSSDLEAGSGRLGAMARGMLDSGSDLPMSRPAPALYHFTRASYEAMAEAGVFHPDERVELVDGRILTMTPQSSRHATVVQLVAASLRSLFGEGFDVRVQLPLALGKSSEPEPDVAVVTGAPLAYLHAHPESAILLVEVADTSLAFDRGEKQRLYAVAGIPEYWVVDLVHAQVERYSQPLREGYVHCETLTRAGSITPAGHPDRAVAVSSFLPPG